MDFFPWGLNNPIAGNFLNNFKLNICDIPLAYGYAPLKFALAPQSPVPVPVGFPEQLEQLESCNPLGKLLRTPAGGGLVQEGWFK
jgi:hypothetical protein